MQVIDLQCNQMADPLGVETQFPRFSWRLASDQRGARQTAYQIIAASEAARVQNGEGDVWNSGRVNASESLDIVWSGSPLISRQSVFWAVRVWDQDAQPSLWSPVHRFDMGILAESEWRGQWIGRRDGRSEVGRPVPAPYFRKTFALDQAVVSGRVYVSGLGFYELHINGHKVGEAVLAPGFTRYDQTVLYQTFDITRLLHPGDNVVAMILGNGWYNSFTRDVWDFQQAPWRDQPKFLLQAAIELENGEERWLVSGPDWKTTDSPIVFDGLRNGEHYDARREVPGWDQPGGHDAGWDDAIIVRSPGGRLRSEQMPSIQVCATIPAQTVTEIEPGQWLFDLGQTLSGWAQIAVQADRGTAITLRYGEDLDDQGHLDTSHIDIFIKSGEFQTDHYTAKGEGTEVWEPRFVYHGFRYVQVSGLTQAPDLHVIQGRVVHTALASRGGFECANPLFNWIQTAARWSTLTNYHSIPTDCPQREKNGWTGDAALSAEQVLLNFDPTTAYRKWMHDIQDAQRPSGQIPGIVPTGGWGYNGGSGPAWDHVLFTIPWQVYQSEGDPELLQAMYASMQAYLRFALSMAHDYVLDFGLGDWCPPTGGPDGHDCPTRVTDTAYFYVMADILAKSAQLQGKAEAAHQYAALADHIRHAFRREFFDPATGVVLGDCQTSQACALYQGMVNPEERPRVLARLIQHIAAKDFHLDAGILGAKYIMHALMDAGRMDVAYAIANQETFPSWGHWRAQGATTLWEQWDGEGSHNHHMFSDISAWFYQGLAGIRTDPDEPGYRHIIFRPQPAADLPWVQAWHASRYGRIAIQWEVHENFLHITVDVPTNCHASLVVPESYRGGVLVVDGQEGHPSAKFDRDGTTIALDSGTYAFQAQALSAVD